MSIFDVWSRHIVEALAAESRLAGSIINHMSERGGAREALIRDVLARIIPGAYEIGQGQVTDSDGRTSKQIDVVIARKDSPCLRFSSGHSVYLVESVLATIEVKSELNSGTLSEALENCASVGELQPRVERSSYEAFVQERGASRNDSGALSHPSKLELERLTVAARPATYVFGFTGYSEKLDDFVEVIYGWAKAREKAKLPLGMAHVPAVIASAGCFALSNNEPFESASGNSVQDCLLFTGREATPLRLLVAHLLYTIQTRVPWSPDAN